MCVCVCARACACVRVRVCVCVRMRLCVGERVSCAVPHQGMRAAAPTSKCAPPLRAPTADSLAPWVAQYFSLASAACLDSNLKGQGLDSNVKGSDAFVDEARRVVVGWREANGCARCSQGRGAQHHPSCLSTLGPGCPRVCLAHGSRNPRVLNHPGTTCAPPAAPGPPLHPPAAPGR